MLGPAKRKVTIYPEEFLFAEPGTHIQTLLGSCIAITLWHPTLLIGGMCHFVLPERPINDKKNNKPSGRYGDEVIELFELGCELHGTHITEYEAKIFGGADLLTPTDTHHISIGQLNTQKAVDVLSNKKVNIMMAHVGESGSRRIILDMNSGDVWVKHLPSDSIENLNNTQVSL